MKKNAKNIMIQGTSSHVGKSVLTAALLRSLRNRGIKAAPFKAQNMALNSSVTADGGEIGRAQAFQAEAAGLSPTVDMNPILLKPTGDARSQVIIHGRVFGSMSAREYHLFKKEALGFALESYGRLAKEHAVIVIEGAGSPAEVNLRENDLANMGMAEAVDSPVLLVGDIDRGGVFASLVGTLELLEPSERERVKGFIINKFRGDKALLLPGLDFLEARTGKKVLGVVPYFKDITLPDEDGVAVEGFRRSEVDVKGVNISVIRLPRISNFTDFDPFRRYPDVALRFVDSPEGLAGSDVVIIPGTKNTLEDLGWLRERGFGQGIKRHLDGGGAVIGICGGFQMLGTVIKDPHGVESDLKMVDGLKLLNAETALMKDKSTYTVNARIEAFGGRFEVKGYEIHMGETAVGGGVFSVITERNGKGANVPDGGVSTDGKVWGTYIHGIFDNDGFREAFLNGLRKEKGFDAACAVSFSEHKERGLSTIAGIFEDNVLMDEVLRIIGV